MPIVQIPSAAEVRDGGGDPLVQRALIFLEPYLCEINEGVFERPIKGIIHETYAENIVNRTIERVIEILKVKGWESRIFEKDGQSWLAISQPEADAHGILRSSSQITIPRQINS